MPAPNRPLLSHMRHGPQHPNAKHRHQPRAHGSDHRIAHAPSQRPRLIVLALTPYIMAPPSRPAPCYGLIIAAPHMSCHRFGLRPAFLFERLDRTGKRRFQTHASSALNYNVLHDMCRNLGRDRFAAPASKGPAMSARSQNTQNPCPDLFCSGHRQPRHRNCRHCYRQFWIRLRIERHTRRCCG